MLLANLELGEERHVRNTLAFKISAIIFAVTVMQGGPVLGAQLSESTYDRIWQFANWYDDSENPVVQSVNFSGRFQYEFAALSADQGSHEEWKLRRMRLGVKTELFDQLTLHFEADFDPQGRNPTYKRLTDFYAEWSRSDALALTVGKQGVGFTMDGSTSSKELMTIDRSNLANNMWFPQEYVPGVSVSGELGRWVYHLGGFSSGEANREFGRFSGSTFGLATLGYDLSESLSAEDSLLAVNYIYQSPDIDNTFTRMLQHMVSVNFRYEQDRWGVRTDVSSASGYLGQSDLWGLTVMPFFNVTDKLQVVARQTYLTSEQADGVRLARYENRVTDNMGNLIDTRGDRYNEFYAGVNYYFYGHKLKLQSGLQFGDMNDLGVDTYSGVSSVTGMRVSW